MVRSFIRVGQRFNKKQVWAIAQLPNQNLQVELQFSDGRGEEWHLGHRAVEAPKHLVSVHQSLARSFEPSFRPSLLTR
jgi:hypothetical protein